jgi:hypothetical protein
MVTHFQDDEDEEEEEEENLRETRYVRLGEVR